MKRILKGPESIGGSKKWAYPLSIVGLSILLTGCGATAYRENSSVKPAAQSNNSGNGGNTGGSSNDFVDPTLADTRKETFTIGGQSSSSSKLAALRTSSGIPFQKTFTITTNNKLKLRVRPGSGTAYIVSGAAGGANNYAPIYGCVRFEVVVNGSVQSTGVLKVPGRSQYSSFCQNAPTQSEILDFSQDLGTGSTTQVTIRMAEYDYRCYWENAYVMGWNPYTDCQMQRLYEYDGMAYSSDAASFHKIDAKVEFEFNGTKALQ